MSFWRPWSATPLELNNLAAPLIVVPLQHWNHIVKKSLRFALKISRNIHAVHVDTSEGSTLIIDEWKRFVEEPAQQAGLAAPKLVILHSPYRLVLAPIGITFLTRTDEPRRADRRPHS